MPISEDTAALVAARLTQAWADKVTDVDLGDGENCERLLLSAYHSIFESVRDGHAARADSESSASIDEYIKSMRGS